MSRAGSVRSPAAAPAAPAVIAGRRAQPQVQPAAVDAFGFPAPAQPLMAARAFGKTGHADKGHAAAPEGPRILARERGHGICDGGAFFAARSAGVSAGWVEDHERLFCGVDLDGRVDSLVLPPAGAQSGIAPHCGTAPTAGGEDMAAMPWRQRYRSSVRLAAPAPRPWCPCRDCSRPRGSPTMT